MTAAKPGKIAARHEEHDQFVARLHAIPKKVWVELSGRKHQVLDDFADRHGAPLRGSTIDLGTFLTWMHDYFKANAWKLRRESDITDDEAAMLSGPGNEDWKRRLARATALKKENELETAQGLLLDTSVVHDQMQRLCSMLREAGVRLTAQFGDKVAEELDGVLDAWHKQAQEWVAKTAAHTSEDPENNA